MKRSEIYGKVEICHNGNDIEIDMVQKCYLVRQIHFVGEGISERPEPMLHQFIQVTILEIIQKLLQIGLSGLGPCSYRHGLAVVEVCRGTRLVNVWTIIIVSGHQKSDSVRSLVVALRASLHFVAKVSDKRVHA